MAASVPLGGNHFTKALTKELKLTFAKAEHLKRNATAARDAKAIFQAMKPVFNDMLTELRRSLSFFQNMDRNAKIGRIVALGNAFKLPGLRRYLSQNLGYDIQRIDSFKGLDGPEVIGSPSFKENILSFGVCYGLALQGLNRAGLKTNLLPKELIHDRLVRQKKPWALASAAAVLLACMLSFAAYWGSLNTVSVQAWKSAEVAANDVMRNPRDLSRRPTRPRPNTRASPDRRASGGQHRGAKVVAGIALRIEQGVARPEESAQVGAESAPFDPKKPPPVEDRYELHVTSLECQQVDDVSKWFDWAKKWYEAGPAPAAMAGPAPTGKAGPAPAAKAGASRSATSQDRAAPAGSSKSPGTTTTTPATTTKNMTRAKFVRNTLIKKLASSTVKLPNGEEVAMKDLGISYPVLVDPGRIEPARIPGLKPVIAGAEKNPGGPATCRRGRRFTGTGGSQSKWVNRFDFVVHFCWKPTLPSQRLAEKK